MGGPQGIPPQQQGIPPQQGYFDPNAGATAGYGSPQEQPPQQIPGGYGVVPQGGYAGAQPNVPYTQQGPTPYPAQQQQQQQPPVQPQPVQQQPLQQPIQPLQAQVQPQPIQQQPVVVQQPQPIQQQPIQQQPTQSLQAQPQPIQQQPQPIQQQPQPIQQQPQPIQQQPAQQAYPQHHEQQPIQTQLQTEVIHATLPARNADSASPQPLLHTQVQPQPQVQSQVQAQPEPEPQPQPQQPISGPPPYVYDASYTYADPNVQAWAQYYAQGGKDLAGSVYFLSIPGVTDGAGAAPAAQPQQEGHGGQHQNLQRQQSLQARQQQVQQQQQQHPVENETAYGSGLTNNGGRAASPVQYQQLQGVTRYQLSDQAPSTAQSQQPQYANPYNQSGELFSAQKQSSPSGSTSSFGARPGTAGSYHSPTQSASTPSWVLPKKGVSPSGVA